MKNPLSVTSTLQSSVEYQTRYRLRQKKQPRLNNISTLSLTDVIEFYIGPVDVYCIYCNAKHFAAEKVSNRGYSFHDCYNHGAVCVQPLPEFPQFIRNLFDGSKT